MKSKCNKVLSWLLTMVMLVTSFGSFSIPVLADDPEPSVSVQAISANGFDDNGKDGSSLEEALSVTVSLNEAVNVSFNSAVLSGNTVSADATVSWNLVSGNGAEAELPAGLETTDNGNEFTITGSVSTSVNVTYKLTASYNGAADQEIFFTIVAEDEVVTPDPDPDPVIDYKVTISANGFDDNGKDGSTSDNALSVSVSLNETIDVSFTGAVVSENGAVSEDAVVSWNLVSGNGAAAELPAGLEKTIDGNFFTISGNVSTSVNETYKLTASCNGATEAVVFFTIVAEDEEEIPEPTPVAKVTLSANGFADNSKGSAADPLSKTASLNEAINVCFDAETLSANGVVLSGNTVSFNLTNADGSEATLLAGLESSISENVFTVSGAVATSSNGAYKLSASCDGFETAEIYFNIVVKNPSDPVKPEPVKEGLVIEGLEESYPYTGAAVKPAFSVVDYDRDVVLAEKVDYTVKFKNNKNPGKATITISGKGNYTGKDLTAEFEIQKPEDFAGIKSDDLVSAVKGIKVVSKDNLVYNGSEQYPATIEVKTKDKTTVTMTHEGEGVYSSSDANKTVILTFSNNVNKGKATVAATGADGKTKKKSFKIAAAELPSDGYTADAVVFAVKGAAPSTITGEFNGEAIVLGRDFTAKYSNNKAAGKATASLKGKGNFTGTASAEYDVEALALDADDIAVNAVPGKKINAKSVIVADGNGAKITKKGFLTVTASNTGKLKAGDEITVTVKGDDKNITGEVVIAITVGSAKKAKVKVRSDYSVPYTGEAITVDDLDTTAFTIEGLTYGVDFVAKTTLNNTKKGNMQVVFQGTSDKFSGTAIAKVKIVAKDVKTAAK